MCDVNKHDGQVIACQAGARVDLTNLTLHICQTFPVIKTSFRNLSHFRIFLHVTLAFIKYSNIYTYTYTYTLWLKCVKFLISEVLVYN